MADVLGFLPTLHVLMALQATLVQIGVAAVTLPGLELISSSKQDTRTVQTVACVEQSKQRRRPLVSAF